MHVLYLKENVTSDVVEIEAVDRIISNKSRLRILDVSLY